MRLAAGLFKPRYRTVRQPLLTVILALTIKADHLKTIDAGFSGRGIPCLIKNRRRVVKIGCGIGDLAQVPFEQAYPHQNLALARQVFILSGQSQVLL